MFQEWKNGTLVFLSIRFPKGFQHWSDKLKSRNMIHSLYREPDQNYEPTALACLDEGEIFRTLKTA
jgi:hypothetical protein